jgi:hypothetical protein
MGQAAMTVASEIPPSKQWLADIPDMHPVSR